MDDDAMDHSDLDAIFDDVDMDPAPFEGGYETVPDDQDMDFVLQDFNQQPPREEHNPPTGDPSLYQFGEPSQDLNTFGPYGVQYATAPVPPGSMPYQPLSQPAGPTFPSGQAPTSINIADPSNPPIVVPGNFAPFQTCVACASNDSPCSISTIGVPCSRCRSYGMFCDASHLLSNQPHLGVGANAVARSDLQWQLVADPQNFRTSRNTLAPAATPAETPSAPITAVEGSTAQANLEASAVNWPGSSRRSRSETMSSMMRRQNPAVRAALSQALSAATGFGRLGNVIQARQPTNAEMESPQAGVFHAGLGRYCDDGPRKPDEVRAAARRRQRLAMENMGIRAHPNLEEMHQVRHDEHAGNQDPSKTELEWTTEITVRYGEIRDRGALLIRKINPKHPEYDLKFAERWNASEQERRTENAHRRTAALAYAREYLTNTHSQISIKDPDPYESDDELNDQGTWTRRSDREIPRATGGRTRSHPPTNPQQLGTGGDDLDDGNEADGIDDTPPLRGGVPPNTPFLHQRCRRCLVAKKGCDVGDKGKPCTRCQSKNYNCVLGEPSRPNRTNIQGQSRRIIAVPTFSQQPNAQDMVRAVGGTGVNPATYPRIEASRNSRARAPIPARNHHNDYHIHIDDDDDDDDDTQIGNSSGQVGMHLPPSATNQNPYASGQVGMHLPPSATNRNPYLSSPSPPQRAITRRVTRSATTRAPIRPVQDYDRRPSTQAASGAAQTGDFTADASLRGIKTRAQSILESNRQARHGPQQTFVGTAPAPSLLAGIGGNRGSRSGISAILSRGAGRARKTGRRRSARAGSVAPSSGPAAGVVVASPAAGRSARNRAVASPAPGSGPVTRKSAVTRTTRSMTAAASPAPDDESSSSDDEGQDAAPFRASKRAMPSWVKRWDINRARKAREAREGIAQVGKSTLHRAWKPSQQGDICWTCWRKKRQCTGPRAESDDLWPVCEECFDEDEAENCMWGDPDSYNDYVANVDAENPTRAPEYAYRRRYLARQRFADQTMAGIATARTNQSWYTGAGAFYTNPGHIAQQDSDVVAQAISAGGIFNPYNADNPNVNQPAPAGGPLPNIPTALELRRDPIMWSRRQDPHIRPFRAEDADQVCRERRRLVPNWGWEAIMTEAHWKRVVLGMEHRYWSEHHVGNSCRCDVVPHNRGHRNFASCGHCRDRQFTFHNQKQSILIVDTKQWFCPHCALDAKREYTSNPAYFKTNTCTCTGQMTVPWLCNLDRDAAIAEVSKRARLMNRFFLLQLQNRAACGHSRSPMNTSPSECSSGQNGSNTTGVWGCKSCRDIVIESTTNFASDDVLRAAQAQAQAGASAGHAYDPKDHIPAGAEGVDEELMTRLAAQMLLVQRAH